MAEQERERDAPGRQDDGSFDLSNLPDDVHAIEVGEEGAELIAQLQAERDEAIEAKKRAMADFVNYRRRAADNETRARVDGIAGVVRSLLPVLDHVQLALAQDPDEASAEQIMVGVRILRDELERSLALHGLRVIDPAPGSEFDPMEHQAVMRDSRSDRPANSIVSVLQVGYALADTVLRPASVSVAMPDDAED